MPEPTAPLKDFYRRLGGPGALPLPYNHPFYVELFADDARRDPIRRLAERIDLAESESVNLLTGFRGNGKSTQLRRLAALLEERGCRVFLVDMKNYILLTKPLEVSDFILSICAALAEAVAQEERLRPLAEGYGERLLNFLTSEVRFDGLTAEWKGPEAAAKLGLNLKTDPTFKQRVQEALRGHVAALIGQARDFVVQVVAAIRQVEGDPDKKVVLLVDSVEQVRGVGVEASQVYDSVINLFAAHAANLEFRQLHVLYTLPPFLVHNAGRNLGGHAVTQWPNIHVHDRHGNPDAAALATMRAIIARRYPAWEAILSTPQLDTLALASGGDLRDFFRLVRETLISAITGSAAGEPVSRVDDRMVEQATHQLRSDLLPIPREDGRWLLRIHQSKQTELESAAEMPRLTRFFDSNLIMNYLNGEPWYDIHPLLRDEVAHYAPPEPAP